MSKSTALAVRRKAGIETAATIHHEPLDLNALLLLAEKLVPTGFLPNHIKNAGQCAAIILAGRELGMEPMRALRSLQMVQGKVIEAADSQLARFKADGGRAAFTELTDAKAVLTLRHPNGDEHTESFTIEDAKRAGLAGKDVWKNYPKAMLRSRVITAGLKSLGWEGGVGAYDPDEAASFQPAEVHHAEVKSEPLATDEQRAALKQVAEMVHVFSREECDKFDDNAARADLTAKDADIAIAWAKKKAAKWEATQPKKVEAEAEPGFQDDRALVE